MPDAIVTQLIPEHADSAHRLGRHVRHDPRSWEYQAARAPKVVTTLHERNCAPFDQGDLGSCFPPGTCVRMADGSERPIEEVRPLDQVVTAEGNTGPVLSVMARIVDGGLVRIGLWGHAHLRCTREHPILTRRGYVEAMDLAVGDEIGLPRASADSVTEFIVTSQFVEQATHRLGRGNRWSGLPGRRGLRADANPIPEKIALTPNTGRLLGLFLAEGSCDSGKARFTFGAHETNTLASETVELLNSEWGVGAHLQPRPNNSVNVVIYGTAWTRLLSGLCGDGAGMKRPHASLMSGSRAFLEAMLGGWLAGDGHVRPDGAREGISISHGLALAMFDIGQVLGLRPVIDTRAPTMNRHAATRRPRWTVTFAARGASNYSTQDERHVWRKLRSLHLEDYAGPVYNLSVLGDESYVAEGIGVHNCTGNAEAGLLMTDPLFVKGRVLTETDAVKLYSQATHNDRIHGEYPPDDTGSSGLAVMKAAKQLGYITKYSHAFGLQQALAALVLAPVITGVNWYEGFDKPDSSGTVSISGGVRGGHEFEIVGVDAERQTVRACNSWGTGWGDGGYFQFSWATWDQLLHEQGDVTTATA